MTKPVRTRVKICGITRVADGLAAAQAGADAVGFVFWARSPRAVAADQARAIATALPPFVTVVALFVDPDPDQVRAVLAAVPVDLLQFHGRRVCTARNPNCPACSISKVCPWPAKAKSSAVIMSEAKPQRAACRSPLRESQKKCS